MSRQVCEWLDWRAPNGKYQDMSCRKALLELERRGVIVLPVSDNVYHFQQKSAKTTESISEIAEIACDLADLGKVEVIPVSSRYSKMSRIWNGLMDAHHYLGGGSLCGAQIRYMIRSEIYGWLGGMSFSSSAWRLRARDEWIGWSETGQFYLLTIDGKYPLTSKNKPPIFTPIENNALSVPYQYQCLINLN
ncbi:MAG: DUF4338 domain-containing protein [Syntrophales bacterium]|nr:DUF4338 domain-containing protein [Syntrophales bacterium]